MAELCGEPDGEGKVCIRALEPDGLGHGGGHWFAPADVDPEATRREIAQWMVTGQQPQYPKDGEHRA